MQYRFYNLEHDGHAVVARIDMMLDDDGTAIAHTKELIYFVGPFIRLIPPGNLDELRNFKILLVRCSKMCAG
jgi:hypothetical protein